MVIRKAKDLIEQFLDKELLYLKAGVIDQLRQELTEAVEEDYSVPGQDDMRTISMEDIYQIADCSIDRDKYYFVFEN